MTMPSINIKVVASSKDIQSPFVTESPIREYFFVDQQHNGDNIDSLNLWLCEITALYYIWKHSTEDIVGLEHYRRFFVEQSKSYNPKDYTSVSKEYIEKTLTTHDAIVAYHQHAINRCADSYLKQAKKYNEFCVWLDIANTKLPGFKDFTLKLWKENSCLICCNMFITKRDIINEYCTWLFPIINQFIKEHPLTNTYTRNIGYLVEFTWGAWLLFNNKRIKLNNHIRFTKDMQSLDEIERTTVNRGIKL